MKKKLLIIYFSICLFLLTLVVVFLYSFNKTIRLSDEIASLQTQDSLFILVNEAQYQFQNVAYYDNLVDSSYSTHYIKQKRLHYDQFLSAISKIQHSFKHFESVQIKIDKILNLTETNYILNTQLSTANIQHEYYKVNLTARINQDFNRLIHQERDKILAFSDSNSEQLTQMLNADFLTLFVSVIFVIFLGYIIYLFNDNNMSFVRLLSLSQSRIVNTKEDVKSISFLFDHNLQEPLRKVQILLDQLESDDDLLDRDDIIRRIKTIYLKQQKINYLFQDLIKSKSNNFERNTVNIGNHLHSLFMYNYNNIEYTLHPNLNFELNVDKVQFDTMIKLLVENSVLFQSEKELEIKIKRVSTSTINFEIPEIQLKDYNVIAFSDNGIGVKNIFHKKIFEMFQIIERRSDEQNGVGLSYAKSILLNHNGWIEAVNNEESGLTILLFFPKLYAD